MQAEKEFTGMVQDIVSQLFGDAPLFVNLGGLRAWAGRASLKAAALSSHEAIQAAITMHAQRDRGPVMLGDVAVIAVEGPITYKSSWMSMYFSIAAIEDLQYQFRTALADPAVKTIAFKCDSPGGTIDFCQEFADEIFAARGQKPMVVATDLMCASAAYWLMSQADTIYASISSQIGSIGAYMAHADVSNMLEKEGVKITLISHGVNKTAGNPYEPLSDSARAMFEAEVNQIGDWFDSAVARGRGVKKSVVLDTFGQGLVFRGKEAIAIGLADKAGTFSQVLGKMTRGRATAARAQSLPAAVADAIDADLNDGEEGDGCEQCDPECPCQETECAPECKTCSDTCPCAKAKTEASAAPAAADAPPVVDPPAPASEPAGLTTAEADSAEAWRSIVDRLA